MDNDPEICMFEIQIVQQPWNVYDLNTKWTTALKIVCLKYKMNNNPEFVC